MSCYESLRHAGLSLSPYIQRKLKNLREKHIWHEPRPVQEIDEDEDEDEEEDLIEDAEEGAKDEEWIEGLENIVEKIRGWIAKIERSEQELFTALGGVDPRPVNRWEAVRTDPYHRFSSTTSDRYKHTWTGKRDQKVIRIK